MRDCPPLIRFDDLKPEAQKLIQAYVASHRNDLEVRYLKALAEVNKKEQEPDMYSVMDYKRSRRKESV